METNAVLKKRVMAFAFALTLASAAGITGAASASSDTPPDDSGRGGRPPTSEARS